jgi:hypothetical protein
LRSVKKLRQLLRLRLLLPDTTTTETITDETLAGETDTETATTETITDETPADETTTTTETVTDTEAEPVSLRGKFRKLLAQEYNDIERKRQTLTNLRRTNEKKLKGKYLGPEMRWLGLIAAS